MRRKNLYSIIFLSIISLQFAYSQNPNPHWETVFFPDTYYRYFNNSMGSTDSTWVTIDYDDSAWLTGKGGIGYGDNDDFTIVSSPCTSVFMRTTFQIYDSTEIEQVILNIDYDDAFVAYLNGVEVARSYGLTGTFPDNDQLSSVQHEAVMYSGGSPDYYFIYNNVINTLLRNGDNIFALQIHNATANSSDLSSNVFFSVDVLSENQVYNQTPGWFKLPLQLTESNLPIFIIETEDGAPIVDEPKIKAQLGIINNGYGNRNYITDPFTDYDGNIGIEIRGNSTSTWPKKPYGFETRDENDENLDVSLLGLPEENDWVLRASYYDRSFVRNPLAHHMSELAGHWSSGNKYCELILNGEYQGIYILVEKIKRTKNRLNIHKMLLTDISGEEVTGGYIYEVEGQYDDFGKNRRLKYPKIDNVQPEQLAYIRKYDDDFRAESQTDYSDDPPAFYSKWIDLNSYVDYLIVVEALRNPDGYGWSSFYHKDRNKLLNAGPVWDFDQGAGNSTLSEGWRTDRWIIEYQINPNPQYWYTFLHEPYFMYQLKLRWEELRKDEYKDENLMAYIDSLSNKLSQESVDRNFEKWDNLNTPFWRELNGFEQLDTYEKHIDFLKNWLHDRWLWMDNTLANVPPYDGIFSPEMSNIYVRLFPNPVRTNLFIEAEKPFKSIVLMSISGEIKSSKQVQSLLSYRFNIENINPGFYLVKIIFNNGENITKKIVIH